MPGGFLKPHVDFYRIYKIFRINKRILSIL